MAGYLDGLRHRALRLYGVLPSVQTICKFADQPEVVDRMCKLGRLVCYGVYATCITVGASPAVACGWRKFGIVWAEARIFGIFTLYGITTGPCLFEAVKDACAFAKGVFSGSRSIGTGFAVNNPNVTYSRCAKGRLEQSLVLFSKTLVSLAISSFAYVAYIGVPVFCYKEFLLAGQPASDLVVAVSGSLLLVISSAFAAFSVSAFSKWLFNRCAMTRSRRDQTATWEDEIQYEYDQTKLKLEVVAKVMESAEFMLIKKGYSVFSADPKCSHGGSNTTTESMASSVTPSSEAVIIRWEDWATFAMGSMGTILAFIKAWMQVTPPEFIPPKSPQISLLRV